MCMTDDSDPWTMYHEEKRRAAKEHRCGECKRTIAKGETYRIAKGLIDGRWSTMKTCLHCLVGPCRWLAKVCEGYLYDAVEEDLFEHITGYERELRTAPLTRLGRWMLADWRDRDGNLRPVEAVKAVADRAIDAYGRQLERGLL